MEQTTIIVIPRDRFSDIFECLKRVEEHTPEPHRLIVVMGGAPAKVKSRLEREWGNRAELVFEPRYLNTAQMRNIGLRRAKTPLAACLDSDVYVRPGWLGALLRCREETGAAMVVPIILDRDDRVHTAGNHLFISKSGGKTFCTMELRFAHIAVGEETNLKRCEVDFGEVHCQLMDVETALRLGVYDERYREGSDIDSGLTWAKAGSKMMFEPASRVYLYYPDRIDDPDDIRYYLWKWDLKAVRDSFDYFKEKWGMDRTGRDGSSMRYYVGVVRRIGPLSRRWPVQPVISAENYYYRTRKTIRKFLKPKPSTRPV